MLRLLLKPVHQLNCLQGGYSYTGLVCDRNIRPTAHTVEQQSEATNPIGSHPKIHLYQRESLLWFQWPLAQARTSDCSRQNTQEQILPQICTLDGCNCECTDTTADPQQPSWTGLGSLYSNHHKLNICGKQIFFPCSSVRSYRQRAGGHLTSICLPRVPASHSTTSALNMKD